MSKTIYEPKIQNGGKYRDTPGFIAFDVAVGETYLGRMNARDICDSLRVEFVPEYPACTLTELIEWVGQGYKSEFGDFEAEGFVVGFVATIVDRQEGGAEVLAARGYPLKTVFTREQLI